MWKDNDMVRNRNRTRIHPSEAHRSNLAKDELEELWQCWECSNLFEADEMTEVEGSWYCADCAKEVEGGVN